MPIKSVEITCPECRKTRRVGRQQHKNRKTDLCQTCYRKHPYAGGPVKKNTVTEKTLDALAQISMGVPVAEAAEKTGVPVNLLTLASMQVTEMKSVAEAIKTHQADKLYILAQILLDSIDQESVDQLDAKERIQAAKNAIDTARILEGKPTEIVAQFRAVMEKYHVKIETTETTSGVHAAEAAGEIAQPVEAIDAEVVEQVDVEPGAVPGDAAPDVLQQYSRGGPAQSAGDDPAGESGRSEGAGADGADQVCVSSPIWLRSRVSEGPDHRPVVREG